jgi:hypothetical protein
MFQFPNWSLRLPGQEYRGDRPDGFATRDEVIAFIERYRERVGAPVRTWVRVDRVRPTDGGFRLEIADGDVDAVNVVVATGPYQEPILPAVRHAIPPAVLQLHASGYRNPAQLPAGAVLVVGSGASGCQIVEDLLAAGRKVFFSVGYRRAIRAAAAATCSGGWSGSARWTRRSTRPRGAIGRTRSSPGSAVATRSTCATTPPPASRCSGISGTSRARGSTWPTIWGLLAAGDERRRVHARWTHIARPVSRPAGPPAHPLARRGPAPIRELDLVASASRRWSGPPGSGATSVDRGAVSTAGEPIHRRASRLRGTLFPGIAVAAQAQVIGAVRGRGRRCPCRRAHNVRCDRCTVAAGAPRPRPDLIRRA